MGEAQAVKARLRALRERRRELEGQLAAGGRTRAAQLELAGVEEDLVACARRLRELEPRHRISRRTTWTDVEGRGWDQLQYRTWAELEGAQPPQGPSPREEMRSALRQAREDLTPTQQAYLLGAEHGAGVAQVAAALGRSPSTVSRGLSRARARLTKKAQMLYQLRRAAGAGTLDLSRREGMAALLAALTDRQALYLFLYYGEWMSLGRSPRCWGWTAPACCAPSGGGWSGWSRPWARAPGWRGWRSWRGCWWSAGASCPRTWSLPPPPMPLPPVPAPPGEDAPRPPPSPRRGGPGPSPWCWPGCGGSCGGGWRSAGRSWPAAPAPAGPGGRWDGAFLPAGTAAAVAGRAYLTGKTACGRFSYIKRKGE